MIFKSRKKIRELERRITDLERRHDGSDDLERRLFIKAAELQAAIEDLRAAVEVLAGKIQQHDKDLAGLDQDLAGTRDKLSFVSRRGLGLVMLPPAVVPPMGPPAAGTATLDTVKTEE